MLDIANWSHMVSLDSKFAGVGLVLAINDFSGSTRASAADRIVPFDGQTETIHFDL